MEASRDDVRVERPRCPFCHEAVVPSEGAWGCPGCLAWHHDACRAEAGSRCAACGRVDPATGSAPAGAGREHGAGIATHGASGAQVPPATYAPPGPFVTAALQFLAGIATAMGAGLVAGKVFGVSPDAASLIAGTAACGTAMAVGVNLIRVLRRGPRPLPSRVQPRKGSSKEP